MARILIIDDDARFRKMFQEMLEQAGYEVLVAPDGRVGMKLYRETPVDLIMLDIFMPEKDGIEIATELKRDFPDVKIITISAGGWMGRQNSQDVLKALGTHKYFAKPFDKQEVLDAIGATIRKKKTKG